MPATRTFFDPGPEQCSDQMLSELLALDEEMIVQLRFERLEVVGSTDFPRGKIDQHEKNRRDTPGTARKP
jgi:hypothetical protein